MAHAGIFYIDRSDDLYVQIALYDLGDYPPDHLIFQLSDGRYASPYFARLGEGVGDTGLLVQDSSGQWWRARHEAPTGDHV